MKIYIFTLGQKIKSKIDNISLKSIYISLIFAFSILQIYSYSKYETAKVQQSLRQCVIRFHVLANSDTNEDQALKMKVKNAVVDYIYKNTGDCSDTEDTEAFLTSHDNEIKKIAQETVYSLGYDYEVTTFYGLNDFPDKKYGDVTFPGGSYTSYTITLGQGEGHNWWCVLYPPLCFTDASTGILPEESKEELKENVPEEDYEYLTNPEPVFRFKYLTFLNDYIS